MTDTTTGAPAARFSEEQMRQQIHLMVQAQAGTVEQPVTDEQLHTMVGAIVAMLAPMRMLWPERWDEHKASNTVRRMLIRQISKESVEPTIVATPEGRDETQWKKWLDDDDRRIDNSEQVQWAYWTRYRRRFESGLAKILKNNGESGIRAEQLGEEAGDALHRSTKLALRRIIDPHQEGPWLCKGLVMGNVQSGKTGHYAGLINKAVDCGYKLIIILAGMTNDLRQQTQRRIDADFRGLSTEGNANDVIGVGRVDIGEDLPQPISWTTADKNGDLKGTIARYLQTALDMTGKAPHYLVIKKNKSALEKTASIVGSVLQQYNMKDLPALIIDDECDQASIDVNATTDPDAVIDSISTINRKIRELLECFARRTYVGYTATPFANVFIWPETLHPDLGADLFPDDFVLNLEPPANYMGPMQVFGADMSRHPSTNENGLWGVVREIRLSDEFAAGMRRPANDWTLPSSLRDGVKSFLLATAIRRWRRGENDHASMLVQCTSRIAIHQQLEQEIQPVLRELRRGLRDGPEGNAVRELRDHYHHDIVESVAHARWNHELPSDFNEILPILHDVLRDADTLVVNSRSGEELNYSGPTVPTIVIGGDKLSRGFTLEGLLVTYFTRATNLGDTLLQMGRWFGYRDGFEDLVRIMAPIDQIEAFQSITATSEELRDRFRSLAQDEDSTPRDWRPRVLFNPLTPRLRPTARNKIQNTRLIAASYAGTREQTLAFDTRKSPVRENWNATRDFVNELGDPTVEAKPTRSIWNDVSAQKIIEFIESINVSKEHRTLSKEYIIDFLRTHTATYEGELNDWTIVVPHLTKAKNRVPLGGQEIGLAAREIVRDTNGRLKGTARWLADGHTVRVQGMGGSEDVLHGLTRDEVDIYNDLGGAQLDTADYRLATRALGPSRGVLMIYLLDQEPWETGATEPVIGWMLLFGESANGTSRHYIESTYDPRSGDDE